YVSVGERLQHFELEAVDENINNRFLYKDNSTTPLASYTVVLAGRAILKITVYATFRHSYGDSKSRPVLTLRELQILGECLPGTWGLYCNKSCPSYCPVTCPQEEGSCHIVHEGEI
ncbi:multiple epidermal growth factor domains protein 10, partial [Biomphalaria glabrata]